VRKKEIKIKCKLCSVHLKCGQWQYRDNLHRIPGCTNNSLGMDLCNLVLYSINPFPALTLQSARDLNVPCNHKRSKALLLTQKNRILFKKDVFTFRTKTLNPLPVRLKVLLHALTGCVFFSGIRGLHQKQVSPPGKKKKS
jgi:hypothetical protein